MKKQTLVMLKRSLVMLLFGPLNAAVNTQTVPGQILAPSFDQASANSAAMAAIDAAIAAANATSGSGGQQNSATTAAATQAAAAALAKPSVPQTAQSTVNPGIVGQATQNLTPPVVGTQAAASTGQAPKAAPSAASSTTPSDKAAELASQLRQAAQANVVTQTSQSTTSSANASTPAIASNSATQLTVTTAPKEAPKQTWFYFHDDPIKFGPGLGASTQQQADMNFLSMICCTTIVFPALAGLTFGLVSVLVYNNGATSKDSAINNDLREAVDVNNTKSPFYALSNASILEIDEPINEVLRNIRNLQGINPATQKTLEEIASRIYKLQELYNWIKEDESKTVTEFYAKVACIKSEFQKTLEELKSKCTDPVARLLPRIFLSRPNFVSIKGALGLAIDAARNFEVGDRHAGQLWASVKRTQQLWMTNLWGAAIKESEVNQELKNKVDLVESKINSDKLIPINYPESDETQHSQAKAYQDEEAVMKVRQDLIVIVQRMKENLGKLDEEVKQALRLPENFSESRRKELSDIFNARVALEEAIGKLEKANEAGRAAVAISVFNSSGIIDVISKIEKGSKYEIRSSESLLQATRALQRRAQAFIGDPQIGKAIKTLVAATDDLVPDFPKTGTQYSTEISKIIGEVDQQRAVQGYQRSYEQPRPDVSWPQKPQAPYREALPQSTSEGVRASQPPVLQQAQRKALERSPSVSSLIGNFDSPRGEESPRVVATRRWVDQIQSSYQAPRAARPIRAIGH